MLERKETKPQQKKLMCVNYATIVAFYFVLFIYGRAKCLSREQCVAALCSSCSLHQYLDR